MNHSITTPQPPRSHRLRLFCLLCLTGLLLPGAVQAATIWVTSTSCNGLQSAIYQAQDGDEIRFNISGSINCNASATDFRYLISDKDISIIGPVIIDGGDSLATLFRLNGDSRVIFRDVTFKNSKGRSVQAGAVFINTDARATFFNCNFNNLTAAGNGGAVYNKNIAEFYDCAFSGNQALSAAPLGLGGAVYNEDYLRMTRCYFGTLSPNKARGNGGAIFNAITGDMRLTDCAFLGSQTLEGIGGAIYSRATDRDLYMYGCTFSDNLAPDIGGAVGSEGDIRVFGSTFDRNRAGKMGGALAVLETGSASVEISTFSANQTDSTGGGIVNFGAMSMKSVTITLNETAVKGGGVHNAGAGSMTLDNCLIAQNTSQGSSPDIHSSVPADLVSQGYNLIGDVASANITNQSTDLLGDALQPIDAKLAPLGAYGGDINIHPLRPESPARGMGNPALDSTYDQRDMLRTIPIDIGAYEAETATGLSELYANAFRLSPNPVRAGTALQMTYQMPTPGNVELVLLDLQGRDLHRSPVMFFQHVGTASLALPHTVPAGLYIVQIRLNAATVQTSKLLIY